MLTTETQVPAQLDLTWSRAQFPALSQTIIGHPATFLDGPGGTQVPQPVIDAISGYLHRNNANTGGAYATSRNTDATIAEARRATADFFNCDPDEVVFGPNMTTLTYAVSRSIGRELHPGDEILLTHLDHDANISPCRALEERGVMERLISGLLAIPGLKLYGIRDPQRFDRRCPTVAVRIAGWTPLQLATKLGERGFFTWDGNYYALNLTERLNVEKDGGFLRIGLAHYNTTEEVERFLAALREI